jgi:ribonucleotide reductase alpha subunit
MHSVHGDGVRALLSRNRRRAVIVCPACDTSSGTEPIFKKLWKKSRLHQKMGLKKIKPEFKQRFIMD